MRLSQDKNDRVLIGSMAGLLGLGLVVGLSHVTFSAPQAADTTIPAPTEVTRAQPARGPVPHAHTITKIAKADGAASIVRDPTDLPPSVGKRGPQRVKVDLDTVEITGQLADGTTYRYWTFNRKFPDPSCGCASATRSRCG